MPNETTKNETWTSLDKAKFVVSISIPILIFLFGSLFSLYELNREETKRVADLRFKKYEGIATELNNIYSYIAKVGYWKELTPVDVLVSKREADRILYTHLTLFSKDFKAKYDAFIDSAFITYTGAGLDAQINTTFAERKNVYSYLSKNEDQSLSKINWKDEWSCLFVSESSSSPTDNNDVHSYEHGQRAKDASQEDCVTTNNTPPLCCNDPQKGAPTVALDRFKEAYAELQNEVAKELRYEPTGLLGLVEKLLK